MDTALSVRRLRYTRAWRFPFAILSLLLAVCLAFLPAAAAAGIEVYPGPGANAYKTDLYRVEVQDGARWLDSYTYKVARKSVTGWQSGKIASVNFTTFGTTAPATVRVTKLGAAIGSLTLSPLSKNIPCSLVAGQAIITLKPLEKAWIVFDGDEGAPLFLFADAPKPPVPPGALYYGPGIHEIGLAAAITDDSTLYLDGGAWVIGTLDLRNHKGVTIEGPGVLSGEKWPPEVVSKIKDKTVYHMIIGDKASSSRDNRLKDITIVNAPSYHMQGGPEYIGGVKLISPWFYSTDGFQQTPRGPGRQALIEHCFAFVGDDVFFPRANYQGNIEIRDCFVSATNNSVFQICYWGDPLDHDFKMYAHDIDIKNYLAGANHNNALFRASINNTPKTGVKNMTFENIHIEGVVPCPLVQIENREYFWPKQTTKPETKQGNASNFVFRNITATVPADQATLVKSTLLGLDEQNGLHGFLFENVKINGTTLTSANCTDYFKVNPFVSNLCFVAKP